MEMFEQAMAARRIARLAHARGMERTPREIVRLATDVAINAPCDLESAFEALEEEFDDGPTLEDTL